MDRDRITAGGGIDRPNSFASFEKAAPVFRGGFFVPHGEPCTNGTNRKLGADVQTFCAGRLNQVVNNTPYYALKNPPAY